MSITELANYAEIVAGFGVIASLIFVAKGRKSYRDLTEGERISFGHYLEQLCIANEALLVYAAAMVHGRDDALDLFNKQMRFHLGFKGSGEWFDEFESQRAFPAPLMQAIHKAIDQASNRRRRQVARLDSIAIFSSHILG